MRARLAKRGAAFLVALVVSATVVLAVAASAQAVGMLKAGAHGRANIVNPANSVPIAPEASPGGLGVGAIVGSIAALALLVGGIGIVGRAGWTAGRDEALVRQLAAVRAELSDGSGEEGSTGSTRYRKAA